MAMSNQRMIDFGEKPDLALIVQLEKKSKCKPLLIFHDESNVINACDVVVDMALQGLRECCFPFWHY